MLTKNDSKYLLSIVVLLLSLVVSACSGGGGGGGGDGAPSSSPSPVLLSVTPSQNSAVATGVLGNFQIDFQFRDSQGDLDGGTFCMDWGGYILRAQLGPTFAGVQSGYGYIYSSLFSTPPAVGNITVQCWLTDKAGNESGRASFSVSQTTPHWPWQWGTSSNEKGAGIAIDSEDSILVVGDYGVGSNQHGTFIAKYRPDAFCYGILQLGKQTGRAIAVDGAKNIYAAGEKTLPGSGVSYVSVSKYDPASNQLWEETLSSSSGDLVFGVAVDRDSNVYVTGGTWGGLDGNVNAGNYGAGTWGYDIFLTKYDSSGNKQWTRQLGTSDNDIGYGVAVDSVNSVYVAGSSGGSLDGQIRPGNTTEAFLVKYDASGNKLWTKLFGGTGNDDASGIVIDGSDNIYVAGTTAGIMSGAANQAAGGFISKFNTSGDLQWVQVLGGPSWYADCFAIALDHSGNLVVTGAAYGAAGTAVPTALMDAFVAKYDSSGTQIWFTLFSTLGYDYGYAVAVDSNNYIYVTGTTDGSLPGYTNAGYADIFIAKFGSDGVLQQ